MTDENKFALQYRNLLDSGFVNGTLRVKMDSFVEKNNLLQKTSTEILMSVVQIFRNMQMGVYVALESAHQKDGHLARPVLCPSQRR